MTVTVGIDIGSGAIETVLFRIEGDKIEWLEKRVDRIRQRDPLKLAEQAYDEVLANQGVTRDDVDYCATTGDAEMITFSTGHFYTMTTHARGAVYLDPEARAVCDIGALNGRAITMDDAGKVLNYKMTSQCASGSGQFLENIARYLGVAQDEIGELSKQADDPEVCSSICAVLAETDVINMVSRGISGPNILKGIHVSMADRFVKMLKSLKVRDGVMLATGGLALDDGLIAAFKECAEKQKMELDVRSHPDSIHAGAIGAAIWGAYRFEKLRAQEAA